MHPSKKWYLDSLASRVVTALEKNRISAVYVRSGEEARQRILAEIPLEATVGVGGSVTVRQLGVVNALEERGTKVVHHWRQDLGHDIDGNKLPNWYKGLDFEVRRQAMLSDVYLCSTNAVTVDGKLVNADGNGNRVAAMMFGPRKVIVAAGVNKIVENVNAGMSRIRNIAAPMSTHKGRASTPCGSTGICSDCNSPERGCSVITIIEKRPKMTDMLFVLVGEELGF